MNELLKAYRFMAPRTIPVRFGLNQGCWSCYDPKELLDVLCRHPAVTGDPEALKRQAAHPSVAPWRRKGEYVDSWGVRWHIHQEGLTGIVHNPPLENWDCFENFTPPSYKTQNGWGPQDWTAFEKNVKAAKAAGKPVIASLRHGHCFLTLTYLRGFENTIYDMADEEPRLYALLDMIRQFDLDFVNKILSYPEVEIVNFPEDLGAQKGPMISPAMFRQYIKPEYAAIMRPVKEAGKLVYMHSDGDILSLVDDLLECGVDVVNLQDRVNGIDSIEKHLKGRVAIDLDIDRQTVVPFGTPGDIDDLIREAVCKLSDPRGGLSLTHELYPNVPLENIEALLSALERYCLFRT